MKVLVLAAAYPGPAEPERAVAIEGLTRALAAPEDGSDAVDVTVVAPRVSPDDPLRERRGGVAVRRFVAPTGGKRLKEIASPSPVVLGAYALAAVWAATLEGRALGPDLLLCHWVLPMGPMAACAAAALNVPLVVVAHGSDVNRYALGSRVWGSVARWTLSRAAAVVAVSDALRGLLVERLGVPQSRAHVVPMGADGRLFGPDGAGRAQARGALGLGSAEVVLLFAGDLLEEKGLPELVAAHQELMRGGLELKLCVAGEGPWRAELDAAARRAPPGRLVPLGRIPQSAMALWMRAADLFVLPSHAEGSPVTVMEALATGLPVVATRVGGIPELVEEGVTGWLVPPGSPGAIAAAIGAALRRGAVDQARARLRAAPPEVSSGARAAALRRVLEEALHGA